MEMPRTRVLLTAGVLSAAMFTASTATAFADDTPAPATTPAPSSCPAAAPSTQPFAAWGDSNTYQLATGGDFEQGLNGWDVTGDAGLVADPEPWSVTDAAETQSLDLPAGSSATSPVTCISADDPTIRFFAANHGDPSSELSVSVSVTTLAGLTVSLPIGTISAGTSWAPAPAMWIVLNLLALNSAAPAQFTFTPVGAGDWTIDDLYVDPWGRT